MNFRKSIANPEPHTNVTVSYTSRPCRVQAEGSTSTGSVQANTADFINSMQTLNNFNLSAQELPQRHHLQPPPPKYEQLHQLSYPIYSILPIYEHRFNGASNNNKANVVDVNVENIP
jgi:hypothetical protein